MKVNLKNLYSDNISSEVLTSSYYQAINFDDKIMEMERDTYYPRLPHILNKTRFNEMNQEYMNNGKTTLLSNKEEEDLLNKINSGSNNFADVKEYFVNFAELKYLEKQGE